MKRAADTGISAGGAEPAFGNGPLAVAVAVAVVDVDVDVEDGQVSAYCAGGPVLDVPAKSLPALVDRTLSEVRLGQVRLAGLLPGR
ncbi:hypothetical protein [Streptomyces fagopyri]|uniref:hypothetical protein n=1 Tax=Streptomyces fagopyri TaxID=2662397 RepID=UPI003F4D16D0